MRASFSGSAAAELIQEVGFLRCDPAIGMNKMRSHRQSRLLLSGVELREGGINQSLNALIPQKQQQLIKQFSHRSIRAVLVERSILQLATQGVGFIPTELSITCNGSKGNGGKGLRSRHGKDAHIGI